MEVIYDGADALLVSATASGKTEAALIPVAAHLLVEPEHAALYVAPTRALLNDLHRRLEAPLHQLGLESRIRHGDYHLPRDRSSIRVLFTTPESLDVLLSKNETLLHRVRYAILDEIHQMSGTPRGDQLIFLLQRLEQVVGKRLQRVTLSATVGSPEIVAQWLCPQRKPAQVITAPGGRRVVANFCSLSSSSSLRDLLWASEADKVLYFVNSRRRCDDVYLALRDLPPYESFVHYSTLTKPQREYVERGFRTAQKAVCVATTTLELGIDIGTIQAVTLIDAPTTVSSFLQRIGRGGRRGDETQVTVTPQNRLQLLQFVAMTHLAEQGEVETGIAGHPYSVLVQQIFSILAGKRRLRIHPDELSEQFGAFDWLSPGDINGILDNLIDRDFLRREPGRRIYEVGTELEDLICRHGIHSTISGQSAGTPTFHGGRLLAHLPLRPEQMRHGNVILFAGRFWRITGISDRGLIVDLAQPVPQPVRPVWGSKGSFGISSVLARGMREILLSQPDIAGHRIDQACAERLEDIYHQAAGSGAKSGAVWYECVNEKHVYYTFAGAIENLILQTCFSEKGYPCKPAPGAEGIALVSEEPMDFGCVPTASDEVTALVSREWRRFGNWISTAPWFEDLPVALKRDETVAQVATDDAIRMVTACGPAETAPVALGLIE